MSEKHLTTDEKVGVVLNAPSEFRERLIFVLAVDENERQTLESDVRTFELIEEAESLSEDSEHADYPAVAELTTLSNAGIVAGRRFDRYTLLEELGRGKQGEVWKSQQQYENNLLDVAVKILHAPNSQFRREVGLLSKCIHPNVVHLYGFGAVDERPYLAMELVSGGKVLEYCERKELSFEGRLSLFLKICNGVGHLHLNGVIHCDLKPDNILVDLNGQPKLADFGLSADELQQQQAGFANFAVRAIRGTPEYASPEALDPESSVNALADIYSMGIILFEMLLGSTPIALQERANSSDRTDTHLESHCDSLPSDLLCLVRDEELLLENREKTRQALEGDLDAIIQKATQYHPEDRYQSASDFANDVEALLTHKCVLARKYASPLYRFKKFVRREPWIAASLFGLVAFMMALCVVSLELSRSNKALNTANGEIEKRVVQLEEANAKALKQSSNLSSLNKVLQTVFEGFNPNIASASDGELRGAFVGRMTSVANELLANQLADGEDGVAMKKHLAETLNIFGEIGVSIRLWQSVCHDLEQVKGRLDKDTFAAYLNLGRIELRGEPKDALKTVLSAKQIADELYPSGHRAHDELDHILAEAYSRSGDADTSSRILEDLVTRCEASGNDKGSTFVDFLNSQAMLALKVGNLKKAKGSLSKAIEIGKELNDHHLMVLTCRQNLVMVNNLLGLKDDVIPESREILRLFESKFPKHSPAVLGAKHQLATYLASRESHDESLDLFREIVNGNGALPIRLQARMEILTIGFLFTDDNVQKRESLNSLDDLTEEIEAQLGENHPLAVVTRQKAKKFRGTFKE
jgi:serine/threonine protein kinase